MWFPGLEQGPAKGTMVLNMTAKGYETFEKILAKEFGET